ncbi:MAG TPA: DUF4214 domain-containing protein, partial [Acidimicrobiales bacterium]
MPHRHPPSSRSIAAALAATLVGVLAVGVPQAHALVPPTVYKVTGRVSVSSTGAQGTFAQEPSMTPDGHYVAFAMVAPGIAGAGSGQQIFRRDLWTGTTQLISAAATAGHTPNGTAQYPSISDDGEFVAYASTDTNLVAGRTTHHQQIFLTDANAGVTREISVAANTTEGDGDSDTPSIDGAGDKVAFESLATNLVGANGDGNGVGDIFVRAWVAGTTIRVSESTGHQEGNAASLQPAISEDGTWVAFASNASSLVTGDTNGKTDIFETGPSTTVRVSVAGATQGNAVSSQPAISDDGSRVAFASNASTLVSGDTNANSDTFVWTRSGGGIQRVSLNAFGGQIAKGSYLGVAISRDGNVVDWSSLGDDVTIPAGSGTQSNAYSRNLTTGFTTLLSVNASGHPSNSLIYGFSTDETGARVAFDSFSSSLVRNDTNNGVDVFVTDTTVEMTPFSTYSDFVDQQFHDFVGRAPSAAERNEGVAQLQNGELTPDQYIVSKARATAWSGSRAAAIRLYWAFFHRSPDQGGYTYWVGKVKAGASLTSIAQSFVQSSEFKSTYGALSDTNFVKLVYNNVLGRQADAGGLAYWVDRMHNHGLSRGGVMISFSQSPEGQQVMQPVTDIILIYVGMIGSVPSSAQFNLWKSEVGPNRPAAKLAQQIRASLTYH